MVTITDNLLLLSDPSRPELSDTAIHLSMSMLEIYGDDPHQVLNTFSDLVNKCSAYVTPEKKKDFQRHINVMYMRMLVEFIETLSKETYLRRYRNIFDLDSELLTERSKAEIYQRRVQLLAPSSLEEFKAALMWMVEKGEEGDLNLLYQILPTLPVASESISKIFNLATQAIVGRVYDQNKELQLAFGFTGEEFADCLINTASRSASEQAKENVAKLKEIKELWDSQIDPEELKVWVRQPIPLFNGVTPLEKFRQGKYDEVIHALILIKEGMPL